VNKAESLVTERQRLSLGHFTTTDLDALPAEPESYRILALDQVCSKAAQTA
jgi:hypothetical protein